MRLILPILAATLTVPALAQDECATALPVVTGSFNFDTGLATQSPETWPCAGSGGPDLWYAYTPAITANTTINTCGSSYDTALEVFNGACAALTSVACDDDTCGLQSSITFTATVGSTYRFRIGGYNGSTGAGTCTIIESTPVLNPANGHHYSAMDQPGLSWDQARDVAAASSYMGVTGHLVTATDAAEQAFVWTSVGNVQSYWMGGFQNTQSPTYSEPSGGWEWVTGEPWIFTQWHPGEPNNTGGLGSEDYLQFLLGNWNDTNLLELSQGYVIEYSLNVGIGTNYCMANANSTGSAAAMSASGSALVAVNGLTLECTDMPPQSFAFFLVSDTQGFVTMPGGSQGNLCLGGAIGRYVGPGQIQNSGPAGEISLLIDLTLTPTSTGIWPIQPGETRNFQCWFRDSVGGAAASNFSDGLEITFL